MPSDRILISDIESTIYRYGRIYELMKIEREIENYRKTYKIGECAVDTFMYKEGSMFFYYVMTTFSLAGSKNPI